MSDYDLWVDFNEVDPTDDTTVTFLPKPTSVTLGQVLTVGDDEGNRATAVVQSIWSAGSVILHVDRASFIPAG